jgi:P27 family predicted phage terminase small subunit
MLSAEARAEWRRVSRCLHQLGLLTGVDRAVLAAYCQAHGRWVQAERALAESGSLTIVTSRGNTVPNPLIRIANQAMADMARYASEFGMTPSARTRVATNPVLTDCDPATRFLG